jgi:N,N'-diacetyllegionaminate synthase
MLREIGGRRVGAGEPLFVIAEIGLNHGGSLVRALAMVDQAAAAGASAVKLQTIDADRLVAMHCPPPAHVSADSLADFFRQFELTEAAHAAVARRAREHGLAFIATPFSLEAVDMLERVGVDAYKIASGDVTFDRLVARCARTGKPLIASTGLSTLAEVTRLVNCAVNNGCEQLALLHCVSAYPVPAGSENLAAIWTLARTFNVAVGLSDHAPTASAVPIIVALGASLYERHFVLSGDDEAIDAAVSSTPAQLAAIVAVAADTHAALGHGHIVCAPAEAPNVIPSRRALHAARTLNVGDVVTEEDIVAVRPGAGLPPQHLEQLVGTRITRRVCAGAPFVNQDLAGHEEHDAVA